MRKRKITLKKRLYNVWTHLRSPIPLLATSIGMGLIIALLVLAYPCGKWGHPENGVCDDGSPFMNPVHWLIGVAIVTLLFELIQSSGFENNLTFKPGKVTLVQSVRGYFQRWPKWRKKWYPIFFFVMYVLFAIPVYITDKDGGLQWYHNVGQFGIMIPFLAAGLAFIFANWARKKFKIK